MPTECHKPNDQDAMQAHNPCWNIKFSTKENQRTTIEKFTKYRQKEDPTTNSFITCHPTGTSSMPPIETTALSPCRRKRRRDLGISFIFINARGRNTMPTRGLCSHPQNIDYFQVGGYSFVEKLQVMGVQRIILTIVACRITGEINKWLLVAIWAASIPHPPSSSTGILHWLLSFAACLFTSGTLKLQPTTTFGWGYPRSVSLHGSNYFCYSWIMLLRAQPNYLSSYPTHLVAFNSHWPCNT